MKIPANVGKILNMLEDAGYEAWIVGGCVRDSLMGLSPHDFDVTTSALPAEMKQVFAGMRIIETGIKHGTLTVISDEEPVEITTFRVDGEYLDSRRPESVSFTRNLREDISRRDFTMNGIAYNPRQGIFDDFGGAGDIHNKTIRCIGDPEKRFTEDALRILRGLRFSASLGFGIEEKTAAAMLDCCGLLNNISAERIFSELSGMLTGRCSGENLLRIMTCFRDIFAVLIPELSGIFDMEQHSKWHYLDVYQHTALAVQNAAQLTAGKENALPLTLAMLFHDIGKQKCFSTDENGEGHFYGHAGYSAEMADTILRRLKCSTALRERVCCIVKYHDMPLSDSSKAVRRLLAKHGEQLACDIAMAHIADDLAKKETARSRCDEWYSVIHLIHQLASECYFTMKDLAISGKSLREIVSPSPLMGEIMRHLLEMVVDGDIPNEPEVLLSEAEKYLANRETI